MKLLWLAIIVVCAWRLLVGRWPWEPRQPARDESFVAAQTLLGLPASADRAAILAAHRRLLARVHPDRGGSVEAVHAADAARDLLLAELDGR